MAHSIQEQDAKRFASSGHWGTPLIWKETVPLTNGFEVGVSGYDATEFPEQKTHADDEALYIISGEGVALIGDEEVLLSPGTAVYVPPHTPHCIKRTSNEPLKAVYCHSGQEVQP